MAEELEYSNDPRAYEYTVKLHEGDNLLYEAELGLPAGFNMPETKPAADFTPVALVAKRVSTKLKGAPAAPKGEADAAVKAVTLLWDFIRENRPRASAESASTAVLSPDDMAWDHYSAAKRFSSKTYNFNMTGWDIQLHKRLVVINADYVIRGTYQAQYDGKKDVREGDYMPSIEVYSTNIKVGFGNTLNAEARISPPSNVGPVGGKVIPDMNATLSFTVSTCLASTVHPVSYEVRGDGDVVRGPL